MTKCKTCGKPVKNMKLHVQRTHAQPNEDTDETGSSQTESKLVQNLQVKTPLTKEDLLTPADQTIESNGTRYYCGTCGVQVKRPQPNCLKCGDALLWNEI